MTEHELLNFKEKTIFDESLLNYYKFLSWGRFYPDLFLDLIKPEKGSINLHLDQRIFMRCDMRFFSMYGTFSRGYAKTFNEVIDAFLACMFYPGITIAISAQTKENAADLIAAKVNEILKYYPILVNELEVYPPRFSKGFAQVKFKNGSVLDAIANAQSTKGQRRTRLKIEESALLNNELFDDALGPVVEIGRSTCGKLAIKDPQELNQQIQFFTTSGFRGSDEFQRSVQMYEDMTELKGKIVLGSNWMLPCWFGRGSSKNKILQKKKETSPIFFAQNYEQEWVGSSDGAVVDINKLMTCRSLTTPMVACKNIKEEFYLGVDVARSQNTNNNQSSVAVGRVLRNSSGRIIHIDIPNIITISNATNFEAQAAIIKKIKRDFNAKAVCLDGNGLGAGLVDKMLEVTYDPITGKNLGCWDTINTTNQPEDPDNAERCLWDMKAQAVQSKVITDFMDAVDSGTLRLLEKRQDSSFTEIERQSLNELVMPYMQTDFLFEEIANLKLKHLNNGGVTIEKVVKKVDKDRFSALAYLIWYIVEQRSEIENDEMDYSSAPMLVSNISY